MLGVLIYAYFLFMGYVYSCHIFRGKDVYFRAWMGGIIGNVILMAGIVLPAFAMGFNYISHAVLIALTAVPAAYLIKKNGFEGFKMSLSGSNRAKNKPAETVESYMDWKIFICVILPVSLLICMLFFNHILVPDASGGVTTGQSTYGDLRLHMSFITSIAEQQKFPPDYSIMPGHVIGYPFFVDMLSSSLYLFGASLRWAIIVPSCALSLLLVMGFYIVAYTLTKRRAAAVLAVVLFFFGGGLGFAYFLEGAKSTPDNFKQIFTAWYHMPTNARADGDFYKNIHWANPINDMIIPQRTTMAGWCLFQPLIWLLTEAIKKKERRLYIILGILSGCMLMIHTHTFMAFGIICAVMFFMYLFNEKSAEDKKRYFINWAIFGGIVAVMIVPQLLMWTFKQVGGDSFITRHFNWDNNNGEMRDPYFWFYLKNWGITALFAVPAVICAKRDNKKLIASAALVFIIAELVLFQPLPYDNNKLFFIPYMLLIMLVADWLIMMWDKLSGMRGRIYLAVIVIAAGTMSGSLSICREYVSAVKEGDAYSKMRIYSADQMKMAEYIKNNTPKDAVILTNNDLGNPVYALTGRDIYAGPGNFVSTHGLADNYNEMITDMQSAYRGSYAELESFCKDNGIDYVYVGSNESQLNPNQTALSKLEKVHSVGTETLYRIK